MSAFVRRKLLRDAKPLSIGVRLNGPSKKIRPKCLLCYYAVDKTIRISNFARVPRFASFNMPGYAVEVLSSGNLTAQ